MPAAKRQRTQSQRKIESMNGQWPSFDAFQAGSSFVAAPLQNKRPAVAELDLYPSPKGKRRRQEEDNSDNGEDSSDLAPTASGSQSRLVTNMDDDEIGTNGKKQQRGTRACLACRKVKMRCCMPEDGKAPCQRCRAQSYECVFEPSMRGKKRNQKAQAIEKSLKQMQDTLDMVVSNIADPDLLQKVQDMRPFPINMTSTQSMMHPGAATVAAPVQPKSASTSSSHHILASPGVTAMPVLTPTMNPNGTPASPFNLPLPGSLDYMSPPSFGMNSGATSTSRPSPLSGNATLNGSKSEPRLHALPDNSLNPLGLLAEASLKSGGTAEGGRNKLGVASAEFFKPSSPHHQQLALRKTSTEPDDVPTILTSGLLSQQEAIELFEIYFKRCAPFSALLAKDYHTPQLLVKRSPFLFTCVCAVASKIYVQRPDLYAHCMSTAKEMGFNLVSKAIKSVDIVQGFLLLSYWCQPVERFEQESVWLMSGIASRQGTELNLWRKSSVRPPEGDEPARIQFEMERMNCERTWLYNFALDHGHAIQTGRPYSVREDFLIRNSASWHKQEFSNNTDRGLVAIVELHRINGRYLDLIYSGDDEALINKKLDFKIVLGMLDDEFNQWKRTWMPESTVFQVALGEVFMHYYVCRVAIQLWNAHIIQRVVFFAFGLQAAMDQNAEGSLDLTSMLIQCYSSALTVIQNCRDNLMNLLQGAPDHVFVMTSYSCVFLLKLINPRFEHIEAKTVLKEVTTIINAFEKIAVDETHTPGLYASFLRVLVRAKEEELLEHGHQMPPQTQEVQMVTPAELHPTLSSPADDFGIPRFEMSSLDSFGAGSLWSQNMLFPGFADGLPYLAGGQGSINGYSPFVEIPSQDYHVDTSTVIYYPVGHHHQHQFTILKFPYLECNQLSSVPFFRGRLFVFCRFRALIPSQETGGVLLSTSADRSSYHFPFLSPFSLFLSPITLSVSIPPKMKVCLETLRFGECSRRNRCHFEKTHSESPQFLLDNGICGIEQLYGQCDQVKCNFVHDQEARDLEAYYGIVRNPPQTPNQQRRQTAGVSSSDKGLVSTPDLSPASNNSTRGDGSSVMTTPGSVRSRRNLPIDMSALSLADKNGPEEDKGASETRRNARIMSHVDAASIAYKSNAYLTAADHYSKALYLEPPAAVQTVLLFNRADALYQTKSREHHEAVLRDCLLVLELEKDHPKTLRLIARIQAAHGRKQEALGMYSHILNLDIDDHMRKETLQERIDVQSEKYLAHKI